MKPVVWSEFINLILQMIASWLSELRPELLPESRLTSPSLRAVIYTTLYLIKMHFNTFASRADPDQAALVRAA